MASQFKVTVSPILQHCAYARRIYQDLVWQYGIASFGCHCALVLKVLQVAFTANRLHIFIKLQLCRS